MPNTLIEYMYRDAANYKSHGRAVFAEALTDEGRAVIDAACPDQRFIPEQVGLPDLREQLGGSYDDDRAWHEITAINLVDEAPTVDSESIGFFVRRFEGITWNDGSRGPWAMELPGYGGITAYLSEKDGVLVVEIDTPLITADAGSADDRGVPRIRVYVNDDPVWENPPYPTGDAASTDGEPDEAAT